MTCVISSGCVPALVIPLLTLADVVAAVSRLKGLSGVTRAAAELHLRTLGRDPKHRAVSHVAAAETEKGKGKEGKARVNCHRMLLSDEARAERRVKNSVWPERLGQVFFFVCLLSKFSQIYGHLHDFADLPPALIAALCVFGF